MSEPTNILSDEFFTKQQKQHEQDLELLKPRPPISADDPQYLRKRAVQDAELAFRRIEHSRCYALTDAAKSELAAVALVVRQENDGRLDVDQLAKVYDELAADLPGLKQQRPAPEAEKVVPYMDEVTGQYAKNPWSEPVDLDSQMLIAKRDPALAEHLQAVAKGVSYSYLIKQQDEREQRERIRKISYSSKEHTPERNPFLLPPGKEALRRQSEFVRQHESEPSVVNWYKTEATPVSLRFDDKVDVRMRIAKRNPVVGEIYEKARRLHARWAQHDVEQSKAQLEAAQQRLAATAK